MNDKAQTGKGRTYPWVRGFIHSFARVFLRLWILAAIGFVITVGLLTVSGQFVFDVNADVTELAVCLDQTFEPVDAILISRGQFYICGIIEGTTRYSASLAILKDGRSIYAENFEGLPGYFYVPIDITSEFTPGKYTANLRKSRRLVAETNFSIPADQ